MAYRASYRPVWQSRLQQILQETGSSPAGPQIDSGTAALAVPQHRGSYGQLQDIWGNAQQAFPQANLPNLPTVGSVANSVFGGPKSISTPSTAAQPGQTYPTPAPVGPTSFPQTTPAPTPQFPNIGTPFDMGQAGMPAPSPGMSPMRLMKGGGLGSPMGFPAGGTQPLGAQNKPMYAMSSPVVPGERKLGDALGNTGAGDVQNKLMKLLRAVGSGVAG